MNIFTGSKRSRNEPRLVFINEKGNERLEEAINPLYNDDLHAQVNAKKISETDDTKSFCAETSKKLEGSASENTGMNLRNEGEGQQNCIRRRESMNSLNPIRESKRCESTTTIVQIESTPQKNDAKHAESVKEGQPSRDERNFGERSFVPEGWTAEEEIIHDMGTREPEDVNENRLKELPRSVTGIKKRIYICALAFMNYAFYVLLRSNIIVGMGAMVNNTALMELIKNETRSERIMGVEDDPIDGDYIWSVQVQYLIVIAFYWGYLLTNIPGGMLAETYGSKHLLTFGLLLSGICMMLVPFAASVDKSFLIIIRFIMGFSQGPSTPATHSILALWIPEDERTRFTTIAFSGTTCGTMLSDFITGIIIKYIGVEANSYILGSATILWAVAWERFFSDLPENYKGISEDEKHYLVHCRQKGKPNLRTPPTPWRYILLSVPLWAAVASQALFEWYSYTYNTHFPTYINNIIGLEGTAGGMVFTVSSSLMFVTNCFIGVKSDVRIKNGTVTVTKQRKQATAFFQWGSTVFLVAICYCYLTEAFVPLFVLLSLCSGGTSAGYLVNYIDLAPNYAGTLVAIGNTITTLLQIAAHHSDVALLTNPDIDVTHRWQSVIWICALCTFLGGVIFLLYGTGKQQKWNNPENIKPKPKKTNKIYSVNL